MLQRHRKDMHRVHDLGLYPHCPSKIPRHGRGLVPLLLTLPPAAVERLHAEGDGDADDEAECGKQDGLAKHQIDAREREDAAYCDWNLVSPLVMACVHIWGGRLGERRREVYMADDAAFPAEGVRDPTLTQPPLPRLAVPLAGFPG